jgi:26S proteasome regulatory subunit T2
MGQNQSGLPGKDKENQDKKDQKKKMGATNSNSCWKKEEERTRLNNKVTTSFSNNKM